MKRIITTAAVLTIAFFNAQQVKKDSASSKEIQEVTMTKKVFQKKADRMVFDVANSPIAKGTTGFDLLKETPMVSSTDNATLKILGKNASIIYINGRKSNMEPEAVIEMLKNMPSENISKIEVITMPSSEFQVEGNQGIINIILKKKPTDGTNGNIRFEDNQGYFNNPSGSITLNYRKNKLGISGNVNSGKYTQQQYYILSNGNDSYKLTSEGTVTGPRTYLGGYINFDYEINDKQNIGFSYNHRDRWGNNFRSNLYNETTEYSGGNSTITERTITENLTKDNSKNDAFNLNYELKTDDKGSKLSLSSSYLHYNKTEDNNNSTITLDENKNEVSVDSRFMQKTPLIINNYGFQADYVQKFKKDYTLSFGGSYNSTKTDSDTYYENLIPPSGRDDDQSNHFIYTEKITGLYVTLEKSFGEKLSTKIGSRFENTNANGNVMDKNLEVKRNNNNFLPYVSVNYTPTQNHNLSYSFSSRVARPAFWALNPARIYLTKVNYIQNNPFTKSEIYYNNELMYIYKNSYFVTASYNYTSNAAEQIPLHGVNKDGENVLAYIRSNYGDKQEIGLTFGMQKQFFKGIWSANHSLTLGHNIYKGSVDGDPTDTHNLVTFKKNTIDRSANYFQFQMSNNIRLSAKKDWFLGINYFYLSPLQIEIGELRPIQSADISVKKIWNNWTFNLQLRDAFGTNKNKIYGEDGSGNYNTVNQNQYNRQLVFTATYNFGNQKLQKVRKAEGANEDIKNRTGN